MRKYTDYQNGNKNKYRDLTKDEWSKVEFLKIKIVVPNSNEKLELMKVCRHIHDSEIDFNIIGANQIAHEYLHGDNIIVDEELYNKLK